MFRRSLLGLAALLLAAAPMHAQEPAARPPAEADTLPTAVAAYVRDTYNDPATHRHDGRTRIAEDETVRGNVAVADGPLVMAGRVEGDVVVINGDAEFLPGASISGRLTVVGGEARGLDAVRVDGPVQVFEAGLSYRLRGDLLVWVEGLGDDPGAPPVRPGRRTRVPEREGRGSGSLTAVLSVEDTYNRAEGTGLRVGAEIRVGRPNPLVVHSHAILRTLGERPFGPSHVGFDMGAEQWLGTRGAVRIGARYYSLVEDVEDWQVSDLETSLSTMVLGRDLRDHYEREGWTAHARFGPRDARLRGGVEFRSETHRAVAAGAPWALFGPRDGWRPQPLAAEGMLQSLAGSATVDTRRPRRTPSTGWYATGEVEHALRSTLTRPAAVVYDPATASVIATVHPLPYGTFTRGFVDVRRYNRLGPDAQLNLRAVAGGSLDGTPLPPQRQHALGGAGTLPGFSLFSLDCGARSGVIHRPVSPDPLVEGVAFYPAYGCDAFTLVQAEARGRFRLRLGLGRYDHEAEDWEEGRRYRSEGSPAWVLFADGARGWSHSDGSSHDAIDVGGGVVIGGVGVYAAIPVSSPGGVRLFVRLQPRF